VAKLHHVGSLEAGKRADVLLLSREPELRLEKVFVNGRLEFDAGMFPLPAELPPPPPPPPAGAAAAGAAAASKATARR
jgi:adenine deaminase